jgi:hypothetical protein
VLLSMCVCTVSVCCYVGGYTEVLSVYIHTCVAEWVTKCVLVCCRVCVQVCCRVCVQVCCLVCTHVQTTQCYLTNCSMHDDCFTVGLLQVN